MTDGRKIATNRATHLIYEFGPFRLHLRQKTLDHNGRVITLAPKLFDTLLLLVQNSGRILAKEELIQTIWPESFVEDGNLTQNIFVLRKLLGDGRNGNTLIQTIPKRGYRFTAAVTEKEEGAGPASEIPEENRWSHASPGGLRGLGSADGSLIFERKSETERISLFAMTVGSGVGGASLMRSRAPSRVSEREKVKQLEAENQQLKHVIADLILENRALKAELERKVERYEGSD